MYLKMRLRRIHFSHSCHRTTLADTCETKYRHYRCIISVSEYNVPCMKKFLTCREPCCHQSSKCLHSDTDMVVAWWVVGQNLK